MGSRTSAIPKLRLGVNVDHVATVRNARGGRHPDPVQAAEIAVMAGADGITAHLREDRRHIRDDDIERLKRSEEHTSELQSRQYLVCRLLLEKKKICDAWQSPGATFRQDLSIYATGR